MGAEFDELVNLIFELESLKVEFGEFGISLVQYYGYLVP